MSENGILIYGAIMASVITGAFSYLSLITSKEQKVSEFREAWINSLRKSISEYIAAISHLALLYMHNGKSGKEIHSQVEMAEKSTEVYQKVSTTYNDIIFRINKNEKSPELHDMNKKFLSALSDTREIYNNQDYGSVVASCERVRDAAIPILKGEWKRVKAGEPAFRIARALSLTILIVSFMIALIGLLVILTNNPVVT
jgi:hypothetical protein